MRLTEKKDNGHWRLRGVSWDDLKPGAVLTEKVWQKLYGALWKLKDYEDTGVDPDEIGNTIKYRAEWIPVTERFPESETYILVSFKNYILPDIATYRVDEDGSGAFYVGDEDHTYLSLGFFVNAWMPLPEPYHEDK